jgi:hypothetical protein
LDVNGVIEAVVVISEEIDLGSGNEIVAGAEEAECDGG